MLSIFKETKEKCEIIIHYTDNEIYISTKNLELNNDTRILSDAFYADRFLYPDRIIFVTNDLSLQQIANLYFGDGRIETIEEKED